MATPRKPRAKGSPTDKAKSSTAKAKASTDKAKASTDKAKASTDKAKPAKKSVAAPPSAKTSHKPPSPAPPSRSAARSKAASRVEAEADRPAPLTPRKLSESDREWVAGIRDMLVKRRDQLAMVVHSSQAQLAQKPTDSADVSDRASEGFEDELAVGLIAIEAAQLGDIEDAIRRIDNGVYGLCISCHKPIPRKRLEILPFAKRCVACEGSKERIPRAQQAYEDEPLD